MEKGRTARTICGNFYILSLSLQSLLQFASNCLFISTYLGSFYRFYFSAKLRRQDWLFSSDLYCALSLLIRLRIRKLQKTNLEKKQQHFPRCSSAKSEFFYTQKIRNRKNRQVFSTYTKKAGSSCRLVLGKISIFINGLYKVSKLSQNIMIFLIYKFRLRLGKITINCNGIVQLNSAFFAYSLFCRHFSCFKNACHFCQYYNLNLLIKTFKTKNYLFSFYFTKTQKIKPICSYFNFRLNPHDYRETRATKNNNTKKRYFASKLTKK